MTREPAELPFGVRVFRVERERFFVVLNGSLELSGVHVSLAEAVVGVPRIGSA
jgi:hypothetical protein